MTPAATTNIASDSLATVEPGHGPRAKGRTAERKRVGAQRVIRAALAVAVLATFSAWLLQTNSPLERFKRGVRSLRAKNTEGVYYSLLSLGEQPEFEEKAGLLNGWLQMQRPRSGDSLSVQEALAELELAAEDEENRALALALAGHALYEQGRLRDALLLFAKSLELDPGEVEAHRWLGAAYYDIGNVQRAVPHLERVAAQEPRNGRPHRLLGIIFRDLPDFERAAAAYEESLARDPHPPDVDEIRLELARCQFAVLKYEEALRTLRDCRPMPAVLTLQAQCYYAEGLVEQATQCVEAALSKDRSDADALAVAATLATHAGDHRRAAELLARAVALKPNEYNLRYRLVQVYRRIGDFDSANEQARGMDELRQLREDLEELIRQANYDASNAQIRYGIAALAERLDMPEMAQSWRKAAQMLDDSSR